MTLLSFQNVSTGYGKKEILHNVSFDLEEGEIVLLIGSNGAGKSTVLRTIYGLNRVWNDGEILFQGEVINDSHPEDLISKGIVYIPQKNNTYANMSVLENLQTAAFTLDGKVANKRIDQVLPQFEDLKCNSKKARHLSGGQKQQLALAMGLIHQPRLIVFDEPFAGLDIKRMKQMSQIIKSLNERFAVSFLIVEHRIKEARYFSQRVLGLRLGKLTMDLNGHSDPHWDDIGDIFI